MSKGKEIVIDTTPAPKHGQVIDIMEALKAEHGTNPNQKDTSNRAATKKKKNVS
jgi:non-homologous end joining protein Ku